MIPTTLRHPFPQDPRFHQTQVHNLPRQNKLCNCVLVAGNMCLHIIYTTPHHRLRQWGVLKFTINPPLWLLPQKSADHPMVESTHCLPNVWGHNPHLKTVNKYCLNHCGIKHYRKPRICPLPYQHPQQPHPLTQRLTNIMYHFRSVIVGRRQYSY